MSPYIRTMRNEIRKLNIAIRWANFLARLTPDGKGTHRA